MADLTLANVRYCGGVEKKKEIAVRREISRILPTYQQKAFT